MLVMDRLAELKKGLLEDDESSESYAIDVKVLKSSKGGKPAYAPVPQGEGVGRAQKGSIEEYYKIVDIIKQHISVIHAKSDILRNINQNFMAEEMGEMVTNAENVEELIRQGNKSAKQAQVLLQDLGKENKTMELERKLNSAGGSSGGDSADMRIRSNMLQTLTLMYVDELRKYQGLQHKFKEMRYKRMTREIQQVKPEATPEEINTIIRNGQATDIIRQAILKGGVDAVVSEAYDLVNFRYHEVLRLEESVAELAQMFTDFALVIDQQGEQLSTIQGHVKQALVYVDEGNTNMERAKELLITRRKLQCCLAVFFVLVVLGFVGYLVVPNNS